MIYLREIIMVCLLLPGHFFQYFHCTCISSDKSVLPDIPNDKSNILIFPNVLQYWSLMTCVNRNTVNIDILTNDIYTCDI